MNWIKKIKHLGQRIKRNFKKNFPTREEIENSKFISLNCCNSSPILKSEIKENLYVCPRCNFNLTINPKFRYDMIFGENNWTTIDPPLPPDNPINFSDSKPYAQRLREARKKSGQKCGVLSCVTKLNDIELVASCLSWDYMAGSIATQESENIIYSVQEAINRRSPYILFAVSGGMRMQEGILSLQQMARMTIAINELKKQKLPFIVVYCAPATAGGTTASITNLSDLCMAERGVTIAFSGKRVIASTVKEELEPDMQKSKWVLEKGFLDMEVERVEIKNKLNNILSIFTKTNIKTDSNSENQNLILEEKKAS